MDHLGPGRLWDLGEPDDPERGVMLYSRFEENEAIGPHACDDWRWLVVFEGTAEVAGRNLIKDDINVEPHGRLEGIVPGHGGVELFEVCRTASAIERKLL